MTSEDDKFYALCLRILTQIGLVLAVVLSVAWSMYLFEDHSKPRIYIAPPELQSLRIHCIDAKGRWDEEDRECRF